MYDNTRQAFLRAIQKKDVKKFRRLLAENGWPKDSKWSDYHLLVKALKEDCAEIALVILDNNARAMKSQNTALFPLHIAVSKSATSSPELIEKILKNGASISVRDKDCNSALHVAFNSQAPSETIDVMLRLIDERTIVVGNSDGLRFLHIACTRPDLNVVQMLFDADEKNCQVSLECGKQYAGYTALHFAVDNGRYEIAEFLIGQGVCVNKKDRNETTPVHLALRLRDVRMIDLLLAHDEQKKNIVNKFGLSYFMVACAGSKKSVVEAYLEKSRPSISTYDMIKAKMIEAGNGTGYTPLHFAVDLKQIDTVRFLLEQGADCCGATAEGLTSHTIAEKREYENIRQMLQKHCDIMKKCKEMRSQDADYSIWGDDYERQILIDSVREIQMLRKTLKQLKIINATFEASA